MLLKQENELIYGHIEIMNTNSFTLAYKVFTNLHDSFIVEGHIGLVKPGKSIRIYVDYLEKDLQLVGKAQFMVVIAPVASESIS